MNVKLNEIYLKQQQQGQKERQAIICELIGEKLWWKCFKVREFILKSTPFTK